MANTIPEPNSGCLLWMGSDDGRGYGKITVGSRTNGTNRPIMAHRLSWELHFGLIPTGMHVCHKCDVPLCVNPMHLFLGTDQDNHSDKQNKGRAAKKLTSRDVVAIRALASEGVSRTVLAKRFGITRTSVRRTIINKSWSHI
jgi:hypothetical protein